MRGWADDIWTQGERFGTIGARKGTQVYEITTHRAEVYAPESRKPEVTFGDDIDGGPVAPRLHHQRPGPAPARHGADRPLRRPGGPGGRAAAHAARPRDLLRGRPAAHAAGGAVRRPLLARARPGADGRGGADARPALHRLGRAHPRRAGQDRAWSTCRRWRCGSWCAPGSPASSCPSCRGSRSSRTRSTGTRTCWPTPSPWSTRRRRTGCCGWPRCSTTWASRGRAPSPTAA